MIGPFRMTLGGLLFFHIAVASIAARESPTSTPASEAVKPGLPADQAADDGLARLFDAVCKLPVISGNASRTVAGLFAFVPQAELDLRQAIHAGRQVSRAREIHPGLIAVDVSLPTDRLNALLRTALSNAGIEDASDLRFHPSAGPAIFTTGYAVIDGQPRDARPGWRHCTHDDMTLSHKAAQHSLRQRALAALNRMRLSNGQTVAQFSRRPPRINTLLRRQLEHLPGGEPAFEPDGICRLTCTLSPSQMTSIISGVIQDAGLGSDEDLKPELPTEALTLEAWAVAPPRNLSQTAPLPYGPRPDWATGAISKTAVAAGPADEPDTAFRNQLAITAARAEAQRQLWMELEQLPMPDGRCVGETIAARRNRLSLVSALHDAVFVMSTPNVDDQGLATVTLGIQRETIWQIVGR